MFKLLIRILPYFFSFDRSPITMGIVQILIFASLVAGTGFFWDLADQRNLEEKTEREAQREAHLEELCEKDDPYCFRRCSGSGAFGSFCRWPCGRNCRRPSKPNNVQKSSENQSTLLVLIDICPV